MASQVGGSFEEEPGLLDLLISKERWEQIRKPLISLFIVLNCSLIVLYLMRPQAVPNRIVHFFRNYFFFFALAQDWGVFAPSPTQSNLHVVAVVTYDDGSSKLYNLPRLSRLSLTDKLSKERYRKFLEDTAAFMQNFEFLHRDIARFVARDCDVYADNHPRTVTLIRFMSQVPHFPCNLYEVETRDLLTRPGPNPPHYEMSVLFTYEVRAGDLK